MSKLTALEVLIYMSPTCAVLFGSMAWWTWYRNPKLRSGSGWGWAVTGVFMGLLAGVVIAGMSLAMRSGDVVAVAYYVLPFLVAVMVVFFAGALVRAIWRGLTRYDS